MKNFKKWLTCSLATLLTLSVIPVVNADGYSATLMTSDITSNGEWETAPLTRIDENFFRTWSDGILKFDIYTFKGAFSSTQTVDIANIRLVLPSGKRLEIDEKLSRIAGIDSIADFTQSADLSNDENGNPDYFNLLATSVNGIKNDLNDDKTFNILDLIRLKKIMAGTVVDMPKVVLKRADSDSDGVLNSVDMAQC